MNLSEQQTVEAQNVNVVSLFKNVHVNEKVLIPDPLQTLLDEGQIEDVIVVSKKEARKVVNQDQFPDQSLYTLEEQLESLRSNLKRIKFYLGELEDILPDKKI